MTFMTVVHGESNSQQQIFLLWFTVKIIQFSGRLSTYIFEQYNTN